MLFACLFYSAHGSEDCDVCGDYVRQVFSFVPGSLAAISLVIVLVFQTSHKGDIEFLIVWPIYVCVEGAAVSTKVLYYN